MKPPEIRRRAVDHVALSALERAGIPSIMARLYAARGIRTPAAIDNELKGLAPVSSLLNADKAAKLLADAIQAGKHIVVSCDYDVDGCASGAVALRALRQMGAAKVDAAMPKRENGYGLTEVLVQEIYNKFHPDVILTVDCGISSFAGVDMANSLDLQVVISDHHLVSDDGRLPNAACIVNPNQPGCQFESKHAAGVTVIFYLMLALRAELRIRGHFTASGITEPNLGALLDLVALATVADVVSLGDRNNRILVHNGLQRIRNGWACAGITALLEASGRDPTAASVFDMGFLVGPRLNAAGRLEDMTLGLICLTTDEVDVAKAIATELDVLNRERRDIEADMRESADMALSDMDVEGRYSIVMHDKEWHQGVIGILASRLKEQYGRPVIAFATTEGGLLKGSGRSIPGLHLRDAIATVARRNPGLLPTFGGHAMAAGLSCVASGFALFVSEFEHAVRAQLSEEDLQPIIETDGPLLNSDISTDLSMALERAVWGQGFPPPLFEGSFLITDQRVLKGAHLKMRVLKDGIPFDAIWFNHSETLPLRAQLVYSLSTNFYNGRRTVQFLVRHGIHC